MSKELYLDDLYKEQRAPRNEYYNTDKVELLPQPDQEPVAWMQDDIELYVQEEKDITRGYVIPLYTSPQKREPLSEYEITVKHDETNNICYMDYRAGFRDAEKAHGIW